MRQITEERSICAVHCVKERGRVYDEEPRNKDGDPCITLPFRAPCSNLARRVIDFAPDGVTVFADRTLLLADALRIRLFPLTFFPPLLPRTLLSSLTRG